MESTVSIDIAYRNVSGFPLSVNKLGIGPKVQPLFLDRCLSEYIYQAGIRESGSAWITKKLGLLQDSIYELDKYGESNWELSRQELDEIWSRILGQLRRWGISDKQSHSFTREIKLYQHIEMDLRLGICPIQIPIHRFYYLKTCDVRLARRLVASEVKRTPPPIFLRLWNYYDLVSEVFDDLTDIAEDALDFNCNRFVLQLESQGFEATRSDYISFLNSIRAEMLATLNECGRSAVTYQLSGWFLSKLESTVELLEYYTTSYNKVHSSRSQSLA